MMDILSIFFLSFSFAAYIIRKQKGCLGVYGAQKVNSCKYHFFHEISISEYKYSISITLALSLS